ncbi:MAG: ABC transporter ATP-binding protein [Thermomicrobiales bacterium]
MTESYDVELRNATKRFGDVVAVDDVNLAVKTGEFVSVIGPSGCGKTTTMRMIAGLDQPDSGEVIIRGKAMQGVPPYERNVALVFQSFALFPHLDVLGNVEFGLRMRGVEKNERRERAMRALRTVGLADFARRRISQLSGGQRQRVALARALVVEPALILLDEPLGSLDARLRIEMQSELKSLQQQLGITFIHVSHNQGEALAMADRIVVMNAGRFEQVDPPAAIYGSPRTRFVAQFVGTNNIFDGPVIARTDNRATVQTNAGDLVVATKGEDRRRERISFVVRADRLRWLEDDRGADNVLEAVVRAIEYTGSLSTVSLSLPSGTLVKMEQHESLLRHRAPRHGATLRIGWDADDGFVLPES